MEAEGREGRQNSPAQCREDTIPASPLVPVPIPTTSPAINQIRVELWNIRTKRYRKKMLTFTEG